MAHILPDRTQSAPAAQCGWTCPGCGHSYAPWVPECHHCPAPEQPFTAFDGHDPGPIEMGSLLAPRGAAASALALPGKWANPGYQHFVRASGEWREITPGLQVLLGQPVNGGEEAILHFRLTPDGSQ